MGLFSNQFSNVIEWEEFRDVILEMGQQRDKKGK